MDFTPFVLSQLPSPPARVLEIGCGPNGGITPALGPGIDKLARLAPLLVLEEFAWEQMDAVTRDWYETQHRALRAAGVEPIGPVDWARWEAEHVDLHRSDVLLRALRERYDQRQFEWRPYLYRWLGGPATEGLEQSLLDAKAIRPLGFRWVGVSRSWARSE